MAHDALLDAAEQSVAFITEVYAALDQRPETLPTLLRQRRPFITAMAVQPIKRELGVYRG